MNSHVVIGADVGGSHITAAAVELQSGKIIAGSTYKQKVNAAAAPEEIITCWAKAIKASMNASEEVIEAIGIAMPGPFDYANGISYIRGLAKYESLYGLNVKELLKEELKFPGEIYFENDASCFGIGESWLGEGAGCKRVVAVTLGTGLGSAFVSDCEVQKTGNEIPEDGYLYKLPYKQGIAEDYISSRWLIKTFNDETGSKITEVKEINELALSGNISAQQLFCQMGTMLGEVLTPWLTRFNAQRLVIGGNVRNAHSFFLPSLKKVLETNQVNTGVYISTKGEESAIAGAAYLCSQFFVSKTSTAK
ncbi:ROK family protein [Pinibacter aurantiacus]|uniref:ROK family protein n=1 Tax=Pinibacter aurantiacus TaxID=2851599 RepID=A0A9E2SDL7_9BACT|nr:ROK family protein [Pinibacter aurantiacus]MBV4359694.1 ROK family protein [Pinibacter aurantiacus]